MHDEKRRMAVNDLMQKNYIYWPAAAVGKYFHPDFKPPLTPKQMLELGVFGGKYMTDCRQEFPAAWFRKAKLCPERHDPALNYFGVNASKPLSYWKQKGWIHPEDPRGWFQWYCRYYLGRRRGRRAPDQALEGDDTAYRPDQNTAAEATSVAGAGSGRRCCTGPTTAASSDPGRDRAVTAACVAMGISSVKEA